MALSGAAFCGARSHSTMFSGVFGSTPPSIARAPTPASGGPTGALGPTTPGIAWQVTQPYWLIARSPRLALGASFEGSSVLAAGADRRFAYCAGVRRAMAGRNDTTDQMSWSLMRYFQAGIPVILMPSLMTQNISAGVQVRAVCTSGTGV